MDKLGSISTLGGREIEIEIEIQIEIEIEIERKSYRDWNLRQP